VSAHEKERKKRTLSAAAGLATGRGEKFRAGVRGGRTYDEAGEGAAVRAEELDAHGGGALGRDAELGLEELVDVALQGGAEAGVARVQRVVQVCGRGHNHAEL